MDSEGILKKEKEILGRKFFRILNYYNTRNLHALEKNCTLNISHMFPGAPLQHGRLAAVQTARYDSEDAGVAISHLEGGIDEYHIIKPEMAVYSYRLKNYNQDGSVLSNLRGFHVWHKQKGDWKLHLNIYNDLPKEVPIGDLAFEVDVSLLTD